MSLPAKSGERNQCSGPENGERNRSEAERMWECEFLGWREGWGGSAVPL